MHPRTTATAIVVAAVGALAGCHTYKPQPLDAASALAAFQARSPGDPSVRDFAARLDRAPESLPFDPADGLTLREAQAVALVFNRGLRAARLAAAVPRAGAEHAGLWADPSLGLDIERIVSGVPDPWVAAGTVGLTIPLSGSAGAAKDLANARAAGATLAALSLEWSLIADLRERWIEWSAQTLRAQVCAESADRLGALVEIGALQEREGSLSRVEARALLVELAEARAERLEAEARALELRLEVLDLLGMSPGAPVELLPALDFAPRSIDPDVIRAAMERSHPSIAEAAGAYEASERSLRLEIRRQWPDLVIGPGFGTDEGDERAMLGVSIGLPLWNRNQRAVAEAFAERDAARDRFHGELERLTSRLAAVLARHAAAGALRGHLESTVAPLADEQERDLRRIAELGHVDPLLILQAAGAQRKVRIRLIDAAAAGSAAAVRLDELMGPDSPPDPDERGPR